MARRNSDPPIQLKEAAKMKPAAIFQFVVGTEKDKPLLKPLYGCGHCTSRK
jgi:hypothetical protein